ncbi:hypothetical protein FAF44_00295 [Nonomuraea sp. MG754425]|uniref:hypothetical protein n=1 Tax=Nonomuraea sp. MG754425 TaxID=2570319 RepID=UPI001F3968FE|nr:hypothetical protein [Nonomuraea sp. MG754425]MCF6466856.1 hypothetical protein [Nonomuraea sp. MG754425]
MPDAPLLHYSTSTAPLQAGTPDKPAANTIDITVSSPAGQNVYCDQLDVAVPVSAPDDGGAYFTENPQSSISGKWAPTSAQMKTGRELGLDPDTNYYHVVFQAPPIPGFDLVDTPLTISITGGVAGAPGSTLTCPTTETSGTTSGVHTPKTAQELTWDTAEPAFYLHSFLACAPGRPTVPRTKFNAGDAFSLTWESNGDFFHLYDGDGTVLHEGGETSWTVPAGTIVNDTSFTLKAAKRNATGFETAGQYATLTITIDNPTLGALTVKGPLGVDGKLTANDGLSVSNSLTADTLEAGSVTVTQYCQVNGDLTAEGLVARGDTRLDGSLQVYEETTLDGPLAVGGRLTVNDDCDVNGKLSANYDFSVSYAGTEKITTVGRSGLAVEGDFSVSEGGTEKITTVGYNGLCVDGDLTVNGRIHD